MPSAAFEPAVTAIESPQTHALDLRPTGICFLFHSLSRLYRVARERSMMNNELGGYGGNLVGTIRLCYSINQKLVQSKTQQYIQQCKIATCFRYSNHHQADISVHGHDMFSAYSMDPYC